MSNSSNILIVDDDQTNRNVLHGMIVSLGHIPLVADDGKTALAQMKKLPPDLVLLDILMPVIDGYEVLNRMKADKYLSYIPVIMITAVDDVNSAIRCIENGADDYLVKPFNHTLLKARIGGSLEKKRFHDQEQRLHAELKRNYEALQKTEAELKAAQAYSRNIIDRSLDMIITVDEDRKIVEFNKSAEDTFGYKREEVVGNRIELLYANPGQLEAVSKKLMPGKPLSLEVQNRRKNGEIFLASVSATSLVDQEGNFIGNMGISRDITLKKKAEDDLKKGKEAAEVANRAKSDFLASMSHEIRTPMNAIIGMADLLNKTNVTPEQQEYIEIFKKSGEDLLDLINNILDISKIEAGHLELEITGFDLSEVIERACEIMSIRAHSKRIELINHIESDVPKHLDGDPNRLRQILINLIGNSIKFTEKGEIVLRVKYDGEKDNMTVLRFFVTDTGIGIPDDKLNSIFDSFTQADSSITRKHGGTGLGLSISKRLAGLMGGSIWVENNSDNGSTFCFTANFIKKEDNRKKTEAGRIYLRGVTTLIVDDNATNRTILKTMLTEWNTPVTEAEDGKNALDILKRTKRPYDLILLDSCMPGMSGFEVAEAIKRDSGMIVMMLNSDERAGITEKIKDLGIESYLVKPVKSKALQRLILGVLSKKKMSSQVSGKIKYEMKRENDIRQVNKRPLRILLAEDHLVNQKMVTMMLKGEGHSLEIANNGKVAVDAVSNKTFDIVLMDVNMPEMDGLEATALIRKNEKETGAHIPIVAMTAFAFQEDKKKCFGAGMDGYLSKPIRLDELMKMLNKYSFGAKKKEIETAKNKEVEQETYKTFGQVEALKRMGGSEKILTEIAKVFVDCSQELLSRIKEAIDQGDSKSLALAAHTIKADLITFEAATAYKLALKLEMIGRNKEMTGAEKDYKELERETNLLVSDLVVFLDSKK